MSLPPVLYLHDDNSVEEIQPDKQKLIEATVASINRLNRCMFDNHRHAIGVAHAKSHGILRGESQVYPDLPSYLAQRIE